ncbi:hypothetical protein F4861DRAFT_69781 [Xylaria intraflava]|nr:hypothetical protein F4861DRAFT_69781 [Xylaria intraflava]
MAAETSTVGWQASPDRRGTSTIIENCLFTIFACTWTVQHLNVPELDEKWWPVFLRQLKWTVITLFFPEFIMTHAILESMMAVENMRELENMELLDDNSPWFFRYLRSAPTDRNAPWFYRFYRFYRCLWSSGARSRDVEASREQLPSVSGDTGRQKIKWNLTHCYFANMGGFYVRHPTGSGSEKSDHCLLTTHHFIKFWQDIEVPKLSEDDLKDKSKTDYFAKTLAVLQIAQLLLSLISRKVRGLASSQLEALTLAFAVCGVLTYCYSWHKPQGVKRPIQVFLRRSDGSNRQLDSAIQQRTFDSLWQVLTDSEPKRNNQAPKRIPNDNIPITKTYEIPFTLDVFTGTLVIIGGIHAIAWNFEFPTHIEKLLWRVATLVSIIIPLAALTAIHLSQIIVPWGDIDNFRDICLDVMREYSWHAEDNHKIRDAIKVLQEVCDNPGAVEHKHYEVILGDGVASDEILGEKILEHIEKNTEFQQCLPNVFLSQLTELVRILKDRSSSKKLWEVAQTNDYPQRRIFGPLASARIVYTTTILYCLARLSIIGVAFSSLRRMPDSVYEVSWTNYIPNVR